MPGAVVSRTVTVKLPFAVLPWRSVELQFTVVEPIANVEPATGRQVMSAAPVAASECARRVTHAGAKAAIARGLVGK